MVSNFHQNRWGDPRSNWSLKVGLTTTGATLVMVNFRFIFNNRYFYSGPFNYKIAECDCVIFLKSKNCIPWPGQMNLSSKSISPKNMKPKMPETVSINLIQKKPSIFDIIHPIEMKLTMLNMKVKLTSIKNWSRPRQLVFRRKWT